MICQICKEEGRTSTVRVGMSTRTCLAWQPYYDEQGNYHNDDPNTPSTDYSCSNGHSWTETSKGKVYNNNEASNLESVSFFTNLFLNKQQ